MHSLSVIEQGQMPILFVGGPILTSPAEPTATARLLTVAAATAASDAADATAREQRLRQSAALQPADLEATLRPASFTAPAGRPVSGTPAAAMRALMSTLETVRASVT